MIGGESRLGPETVRWLHACLLEPRDVRAVHDAGILDMNIELSIHPLASLHTSVISRLKCYVVPG